MKRRLLIATAFLLAGAFVNVSVAWGCALWVRGKYSFEPAQNVNRSWYERAMLVREKKIEAMPHLMSLWTELRPPGWPHDIDDIDEKVGFGLRDVRLIRDRVAGDRTAYFGRITFCGWPTRSLRGSVFATAVLSTSSFTVEESSDSFVLRWVPWRKGGGLIPLAPLWPGFAVNTILYATLLWFLICGPFAIRRVIRARRSLCPACAYPRGEADVCSECGKALPRRAMAVA